MGFIGKILAGGLGWAFAGPIGAIIGVVLASIFDGEQELMAHRPNSQRKTSQSDFMMSMLVLLAAVMKADGRVVKSELDVVKAYLRQLFDEQTALEALQILKGLLEQPIQVEPVAAQISNHLNSSSKRELLHMLFAVAYADQDLSPTEEALLLRIATILGVTDNEVRSIRAMFGQTVNPLWAYDVLEITEQATNDEVKKAFRKMAMKYHPDRVNTLGEEVKRSATEKFRKVQEAYDEIKKQRNIN